MLFNDPTLQSLKQKFEQDKVKKEGIIKTTGKGFGFLECTNKMSFFIPAKYMKNVLHGDKVVAVIEKFDNGREIKEQAIPESLVTSVLERFCARVYRHKNSYKVICDDVNLKQEISADDHRKDKSIKLEDGDFVICKLTKHALKDNVFKASIKEFVAKKDDPKLPWTVSLRTLDLPLEPPAYDENELKYKDGDLFHEDLTHLPFVTIDSEKTKDMDDAIYVEKINDDFILYVAIADPSAYISYADTLDKEAEHRAFSIYLPGRDIPMLPRALSDDLCSLIENQERSSLVCKFKVLADGSICLDTAKFYLAKIKSYRRLNYNDVSDYLEKGVVAQTLNLDDTVSCCLKNLEDFAKARDKYRQLNAASFKNRPDYNFVLKDDGSLDHIELNFRRIANQIVEECMISANLVAGHTLATEYGYGIFNTHAGFDLRYKKEIIELLVSQGYDKTEDENVSTIEGFSEIRRYANNTNNMYLDSRIRKLQEYSQISSKPGPHFALGVNNYATFTSPIRKYGDLLNHRLLKAFITGQKDKIKLPLDEIIDQMNVARRINRSVERNVKDWLYVDYLQNDMLSKKVFKAEVFDVTRAGIRLILLENGAMGFMPASMLSAGVSQVEINNSTYQCLVNDKVVMQLGDEVEVTINSMNKDTRSIILELVHKF